MFEIGEFTDFIDRKITPKMAPFEMFMQDLMAYNKKAKSLEDKKITKEIKKISTPMKFDFENSLGMKFVYIKPGSFIMGPPPNQTYEDERQHKVSFTHGFYMQNTEVTQGQWEAVMLYNPSYFNNKNCSSCPVESVSWNDVNVFINRLNALLLEDTYRLPTESEWEYACRADTTTAVYFGSSVGNISEYEMHNNSTTYTVASKVANPWGLYDIYMNVAEWCDDYYYKDYPYGQVVNPIGRSDGTHRVIRGYYGNISGNLRSFNRHYNLPDYKDKLLGFRLVRNADDIYAEDNSLNKGENASIKKSMVLAGSPKVSLVQGEEPVILINDYSRVGIQSFNDEWYHIKIEAVFNNPKLLVMSWFEKGMKFYDRLGNEAGEILMDMEIPTTWKSRNVGDRIFLYIPTYTYKSNIKKGLEYQPEHIFSDDRTINDSPVLANLSMSLCDQNIIFDFESLMASVFIEPISPCTLIQVAMADLDLLEKSIYARYGKIFQEMRFRSYFKDKEWYIENSKFESSMLTPVQMMNINLINQVKKIRNINDQSGNTNQVILDYNDRYTLFYDQNDIFQEIKDLPTSHPDLQEKYGYGALTLFFNKGDNRIQLSGFSKDSKNKRKFHVMNDRILVVPYSLYGTDEYYGRYACMYSFSGDFLGSIICPRFILQTNQDLVIHLDHGEFDAGVDFDFLNLKTGLRIFYDSTGFSDARCIYFPKEDLFLFFKVNFREVCSMDAVIFDSECNIKALGKIMNESIKGRADSLDLYFHHDNFIGFGELVKDLMWVLKYNFDNLNYYLILEHGNSTSLPDEMGQDNGIFTYGDISSKGKEATL